MNRSALVLALLLVVALLPFALSESASPGDAAPEYTVRDFLEVPIITSPEISPDGKRVAYLWQKRSIEEDRRERRLYVVPADGGAPLRLTFGDTQPSSVAWRDNDALSYISSQGGTAQVWLHPFDGSAPRPITEFADGVSGFFWSPDGKRLAVLASPAETEGGAEESETGDWTVYDRLEHPAEYPQLHIVDIDDEDASRSTARQLTKPPLCAYHAAWSPDGKQIALTFNRRFSSLVDEDQSLGLLDVESGSLTQISPDDRHASYASFSPDGSRLAFFQDRDAEYRTYLNVKDVLVRQLDTGETVVATPGSELEHGGTGSLPSHAPIWSADGKSLYLPAAERTRYNLMHLELPNGVFTPVTPPKQHLDDFSMAAGRVVWTESALHRPGSLHVRSLDDAGAGTALASTDGSVAAFELPPAELLELPGHDGGFVEGFLFLPPGGRQEGGLPTIIEMHGGPYSRYGDRWTTRYPWQVLAKAGFAVFIANPRGGTGYGVDFRRGVYRNFGTNDYLDLMAATDALIERGIAEPERMGFTGYSYGGLMTNTVITRTSRFKAAVSIAGIYNYVSAMGQNNPQLFIDSYDQPWASDLERMWRHSPASRAHKITTPTLVMHGLEDHPVDPRQSIELFSYMQLNGVPSRLVLYPDEGHGINLPSHMLDYETRELEWFKHYLLGDTEAAGADDPLPVEPTKPVKNP